MDHFILITRHNFTSAGCVQIKVMRKHFFSECVSVTEGHQCLKKTTKKEDSSPTLMRYSTETKNIQTATTNIVLNITV